MHNSQSKSPAPCNLVGYQRRFLLLNSIGAILAVAILAFACLRIDFHADETIYFSSIPVNVSNDNGLVFHLVYQLFGIADPSPSLARWISMCLGCILIAATTRIVWRLLLEEQRWLSVFVPLLIVISYQGIFAILRVRPEISWLTITAVSISFLVEYRSTHRPIYRLLFLLSLVLLPMNHQLSLFAAALILLYMACFSWSWIGKRWVIGSFIAVCIGLVLNNSIRHWLVDGSFSILPSLASAQRGPFVSPWQFVESVFWTAPRFLNDRAAYPSWWNSLGFSLAEQDGLHCLVSTWLWTSGLLLPCFFKTWESRFVATTPLMTLAAFYFSRYYNPTYAPLPTILVSVLLYFVFASEQQWNWRRCLAGSAVAISLLNGASFLSTRVLNHGTATFFVMQKEIRDTLDSLPDNSVVAISERFKTAVPSRMKSFVLFKDPLYAEVDYLVIDHYDFDMYRFVPGYDQRRTEIEQALHHGESLAGYRMPVYKRDRLLPGVTENQSLASQQGSWFLRNGVDYKISCIMRRTATDSLRTAESSSGSLR